MTVLGGDIFRDEPFLVARTQVPLHIFVQCLAFKVLGGIAQQDGPFGVVGMVTAFGLQAVVDDAIDGVFTHIGTESDLGRCPRIDGRDGDFGFGNIDERSHEIKSVVDFHRLAFALVFNIERQIERLAFQKAVHFVSVQIGDAELAVFQVWRFHREHHAIGKSIVCILHFQVELHLFLVVQLVSEMHSKSVVLQLDLVGIHASKGG